MTVDIAKKIQALSPEGQVAVLAFVEFLLSRQEAHDQEGGDHNARAFSDLSSSQLFAEPDSGMEPDPHHHQTIETRDSGIILAEECEITKEDRIDFADINARFPAEENTKEPGKKKDGKMFDWL
jgi:hypothetical protein